MADTTELQRRQKRWAALVLERASWISHWMDLARYLMPRSGRFLNTDPNRGDKKHNDIYDSTGVRAKRILAAGLMAGMTSPARPWFRLKTPDAELNENSNVKQWLADVTRRMRDIFNDSNTYRALHALYEELSVFGTSAMFVLDDFEHVIHCAPLTIGEYTIATDAKGNVVALYRQFDMTVDQLVREFGIDSVTDRVRNMYNEARNLDTWIPVMHIVQPREGGYDPKQPGAKNMAWESCYFETQGNEGKYLREGGYPRFPAVCPRWVVTSTDIYGESPGMEALGDVKQLQHEQLRKAQGIDYAVLPPMSAPSAMRNQPIQSQPGGYTYGDFGPQQGIKPLFEGRLDLSPLLEDIQDVRNRINESFYVPLFLMLAQSEGTDMTAREVAERHEEKLLMLGPVLERLHNELLSPLINITFDRMMKAGIVPPPPPELQGQDLKVQFISMLAQAQQAVGLNAIDRLIGTVGSAAQFKPEMLDKLDGDAIVDEYADMLGVDPKLIVADDKVAAIRAQRAQQQQAMQQAEQAPAAAQTAQTLSKTDTTSKNGLTDVMNMFSGYSTPQSDPNAR